MHSGEKSGILKGTNLNERGTPTMVTYEIPCLLGLEKLVADESKRLGLQEVRAENGRVLCRGSWADLSLIHI